MVESYSDFIERRSKIIFSFNFKRFETDFEILFFFFLFDFDIAERNIDLIQIIILATCQIYRKYCISCQCYSARYI